MAVCAASLLQAPVLSIDLAPTILDICGVNLSSVNVDGQSFLPQMVSSSLNCFPHCCMFFLTFLNVSVRLLRCVTAPCGHISSLSTPERGIQRRILLVQSWVLDCLWVAVNVHVIAPFPPCLTDDAVLFVNVGSISTKNLRTGQLFRGFLTKSATKPLICLIYHKVMSEQGMKRLSCHW